MDTFRADTDSYSHAAKSHAQAASSVQTWIDGMPPSLAQDVLRTHGKIAAPFSAALQDVLAQRSATGAAVRDGHTNLSNKLVADAALFTGTDIENAENIKRNQA